jgi:hypothetical protein
MADTRPQPTLTEDAKERIRLEEQFRLKARSEQEEEDSKKNQSGSILPFLNSKLGIVVLSTILVPTIGGLYAHMQQRAAQRSTQNQQTIKLLTEFDWRIAEIEYHKNGIPHEANPDKWASAAYIWRAIVGDPAFIPTQPEFQRVHLAGIVSQLRSLGYEDPGDLAFKTIKEMESGGRVVPLPDQPPQMDHTYDVSTLETQLGVLKKFRQRIAPRSGIWELIW